MPNRDKTGPQGEGPKTGRQLGNCEGAEPQQGFGRGRRLCGRGFRRFWGRFQNDTEDATMQKKKN